MKGQRNSKEAEIKRLKKILKDFGIRLTVAKEKEWLTMNDIQIRNSMRTLIREKLGGDE